MYTAQALKLPARFSSLSLSLLPLARGEDSEDIGEAGDAEGRTPGPGLPPTALANQDHSPHSAVIHSFVHSSA